MLKKFLIHERDVAPVGELVFDTDTREFTLRVYENVNPKNTPAFMYFMIKYNRMEVTGDLAMCFVRERLVPPERANIAQILADLKMPYYDELLFLEKLHGRCVMDDFLVTPTYDVNRRE